MWLLNVRGPDEVSPGYVRFPAMSMLAFGLDLHEHASGP
jgi:hypothetical protein